MKKTMIQLSISLLCSSMLLACGGSGDKNNNGGNPDNPTNPTTPNDPKTKVYVDVEDGGVTASNLYVVANTNDPTSIKLANDYMAARKIPSTNLISVALPVKVEITPVEAQVLSTAVSNATNAKGFALAWSLPYRVGANQSITSYVSDGQTNVSFSGSCNPTPSSTYFDSGAAIGKTTGYKTSTIKPAMLLASYSSRSTTGLIDPLTVTDDTKMTAYLAGIKSTIDSGIKADYVNHTGTAYYLKTNDDVRSSRYIDMQSAVNNYQKYLTSQYIEQNTLGGKKDILVYQTGLASLDPSENGTNTYLPGSVGDTLTSFSGRLYDSSGQVSALEFLKAGATASYGTVREPCSYLDKFPRSSVLVSHYLSGDTLIEAYNKSVSSPTEGLFIGEPLARPYSRIVATNVNGQVFLENRGGVDGFYKITYKDKVIAQSLYLKQGEPKANIGTFDVPEGENPILKAVLQK